MKNKTIMSGLLAATFMALASPMANAQDNSVPSLSDEQMIQLSQGFHLAYIKSDSPRLNSYAERGLTTIGENLLLKTSTPISRPVVTGLDLESDELNLFPFIYMPVTYDSKNMSETARANLQRFIDHGGILMVDTGDITTTSACRSLLQEVIGDLRTQPFVPMAADHTLTKTFYLLQDNTVAGGDNPFCVERNDENDVESLSNIIITDQHLARSWAGLTPDLHYTERDRLIRQAVNTVMYANTGDYKTDITHVPAILERLEAPNR